VDGVLLAGMVPAWECQQVTRALRAIHRTDSLPTAVGKSISGNTMKSTRRQFLRDSAIAATAVAIAGTGKAMANPMGQPLGFQTFEIIPDLSQDWQGTWNKMASYGYTYADLVQFVPAYAPKLASKAPQDILDALHAANLKVTNGHFSYSSWMEDYDKTVAIAHALGLKSVICTLAPQHTTADDYKKMADALNTLGKKLQPEGFLLGYHNHQIEFVPVEGQIPWDILVTNTDPKLVSYQIDVGNLSFAGADAVTYLSKYPGRYFSLHVKDFRKGIASVPVGQGDLPWPKIFAIARQQQIKSYVAEVGAYGIRTLQGEPMAPASMPVLESFKESADFLKTVK
jgi:sugar phosphate isomerase/epimerase